MERTWKTKGRFSDGLSVAGVCVAGGRGRALFKVVKVHAEVREWLRHRDSYQERNWRRHTCQRAESIHFWTYLVRVRRLQESKGKMEIMEIIFFHSYHIS